MKKMTMLLAWLCFSALSMSAETIYLNANGGCIDRMEYQLTNGSAQKVHTVFSLSPQADTKLFLTVGTESGNVLDRLPGKLQSCDQARTFDLNTIRRINVGELEVYVVHQTPQGYSLKKVNSGAWMQNKGQEVNYVASDMDLKANLNYINYGTPLSSSLSKSKVSMDNFATFDCSSMISFRKSPNRSGVQQSSFQLVPELGITSVSYGSDASKASNKMQLKTINGRDFNAVLSNICGNSNRNTVSTYNNQTRYNGNSDAVVYTERSLANVSYDNNAIIDYHNSSQHRDPSMRYNDGSDNIPRDAIHVSHIGLDGVERAVGYQGKTTVQPVKIVPNAYNTNTYNRNTEEVFVIAPQKEVVPTSYEKPEPAIVVKKEVPKEYFTARSIETSPNPCGASAERGYHLVQKGETLYAISRKYNVPVKQVQKWNALQSSTIKPCMAIRVNENGAPNPAVVVTKPAPKPAPIVKTTPVVKPKPAPTPAPRETYTEKSVKNTDMKWLEKGECHTVETGETVTNLAARYGYTEERFRYINGFSNNETARIGQCLRTTDCNCLRAPSPYEAEDSAILMEKEIPSNYAAEDAQIFTEKSATRSGSIAKSIISKNSSSQKTYSQNSYVQKSNVPSEYDVVSLAPEGRLVHVVRKEDTLFSLAKRYQTTVPQILALNGMDKGEVIIPAQRLYVK